MMSLATLIRPGVCSGYDGLFSATLESASLDYKASVPGFIVVGLTVMLAFLTMLIKGVVFLLSNLSIDEN